MKRICWLLPLFAFPLLHAAPRQTLFVQTFSLVSTIDPFTSKFQIRDGAFFAFNPNPSLLHLRATLTATSDPNFEFIGGQRGTFVFPDLMINAYSDCASHTGFLGYSFFGFAIPFAKIFPIQGFQLRVESISGQSFYLYGPSDGFNVVNNQIALWIDVYHAAWQAFDRQIPVTYDTQIGRYVVPFANMWHRTSDYPRGWQTLVTITRAGASGTLSFTINNQNQSGGHGHAPGNPIPSHNCCGTPGSSCGLCDASHSFTTMCKAVTLATSANSVSQDAYRFHIVDVDARANHDGQLSISGPSATVTARVFPNSSGTTCSICP